MSDVTRILVSIEQGDPRAAEELLPLIYDELRILATAHLARERPGQTLQPTALVHEAWLRLVGSGSNQWNSRGHFFGAAAEAMRRILVDRARKKARLRHGGQLEKLDLSQVTVATEDTDGRRSSFCSGCGECVRSSSALGRGRGRCCLDVPDVRHAVLLD